MATSKRGVFDSDSSDDEFHRFHLMSSTKKKLKIDNRNVETIFDTSNKQTSPKIQEGQTSLRDPQSLEENVKTTSEQQQQQQPMGDEQQQQPQQQQPQFEQENNLFDNETEIFENDAFDMKIKKVDFQRQKHFKIEDHLYLMRIFPKQNIENLPLLKDIQAILENSLVSVINKLKSNYLNDDENLIFITLAQDGMVSPIRSEGIDLQQSSPASIVRHVMNMFHQFCNSNEELHLNNTFRVYFKVFSRDHVYDPRSRRQTYIKTMLGSKNIISNFAGTLSIPNYQNNCMLLSLIVLISYFNLENFKTREFYNYKPLWLSNVRPLEKEKALLCIRSKLEKITRDLSLKIEGPRPINDLYLFSEHFNCQIHVIINNQEKQALFQSFPETLNLKLPQYFLLQLNDNHLVPILNVKKFFSRNKYVCLHCRSSVYNFRIHKCLQKSVQCQNCLGYIVPELPKFKQSLIPYHFCINKNTKQENSVSCKKCKNSFLNMVCFQNHFKSICSTKKKSNIFCEACKKFVKSFSNHLCISSLTQKYCYTCKTIYSNDEYHMCQFSKQEGTHVWRPLAFIDFLYSSENVKEPICCSLFFEHKPEIFTFYIFWNDVILCDMPNCDKSYSFKYDIHNKRPLNSNSYPYAKKFTEQTVHNLNMLKEKNPTTAVDKLISFLFSEASKNAVILSLNEFNQNMSVILGALTQLGLLPRVMKKENSFLHITTACQNLLFLNVSNYFKMSREDLANQFQFEEELIYFPLR